MRAQSLQFFRRLGDILFFVLAVAVPLLFTRDAYDIFFPSKYIFIFITVFIFAGWLTFAGGRRFFVRTQADPYLLLWLAAALFSAFSAPVFSDALEFLIKQASFFLVYRLALFYFAPEKRERGAFILLAGAALAAAYAVLQYAGADFIKWSIYIPGTMGNPNLVAEYLLMALPLSFYMAFSGGRKNAALGAAFFMLVFSGLIVTKSRAGFVGLIISVLVFFFFYTRSLSPLFGLFIKNNRKRLVASALIAAAAVVAVIAATGILSEMLTVYDEMASVFRGNTSGSVRITLWKTALAVIRDHSFAGCGTGGYRHFYTKYQPYDFMKFVAHFVVHKQAHNDFLQIWAENGIFALGFFLAALAVCFAALARKMRSGVHGEALLGAALAACLAAVCTSMFFSFPLQAPASSSIIFILMGFCLAPGESRREDAFFPAGHKEGKTLGIVVGALGLLFLFSVLNYFSSEIYFKRGSNYYDAGKYSVSTEYFKKFLELKNAGDKGPYALSKSLYNEGKYPEAARYADLALSYAPSFEHYYFDAAIIYKNLGEEVKSLYYMKTALKINLAYPEAIQNIVGYYAGKNMTARAAAYSRLEIIYSSRSNQGYENLGNLYAMMGDYDKAEKTLSNLLLRTPGRPGVFISLAKICAVRGDTGRSVEYLKAALAADPGNSEAGRLLSQLGPK